MEINQYAVTASEMKDLSFLDIDQYVSAGVYQSQKVPVSLVKAYMLSENIEQILLADMQALALAGDLVSLKNYIIDDGSSLYLTMAAGGVGNQIYQYAIDVTTGLFGTFDLVSGVFTQTSGNTLILEISAAALDSLQSASTLSLTTIYIVTDAPYKVALQAEAVNKIGANGTIIDLTYSGSVYYDLATNTIVNGTMSDIDGNTWNGCLPTDVILGADCFNNTFGQGSNGFTFGDDLKNVTIEAGITGADYSNATTYAFLYNKAYSSTIFQSGGINYHRYFDIANDRIEITDLATPANITFIGGGGATPNIQQVLDTGNTSTTAIKIDNGTGNYVQVNSSNILMEDSSSNALSIYPDSITIQNPSFGAGTIKATTLAYGVTFELPNKAAGTQTFAMLSDIGAGSGTVTSVGLSMPSAFSVASSPITTSGTIAVTGAGLSSQYVRGDGSLANFPSSGGGGASVNYYLNGSVSQGTFGGVAMREVNRTPIIGTGTDFTIATNGYIQSFITDTNDPNQLVIPAGNWNFETYFSASSGGGSPSFYIELHKWDGATLTLIASNSATPEAITGGTTIDLYLSAIAVPQTTLALTDRLAIRIYVNNSSRTITLHTENSHLCQVITTFTTGLTALNGLTEQVQTFAVGTSGTDFAISSASSTHTFNLPTASATNRGALSSSDWSAFNAKVSSFASATDGTASSGTSNTISISVLIPANTFALDDVIRINHRVRATGVLGIRETRVYANTSASLTGAILISTASLTSTTLAANMQRFLAIKNASTNTEVVTATTNQLTDYASFTTAVSTLLINWTVDQYIIFAVNALNGGDSIRATMYSIEKL